MDVIISIRPEYADKIIQGTKKYEFRTRVPYADKASDVFIYSTAPVQRIIAYFPFTEVLEGSPEEIWDRCVNCAGIGREEFFRYFEGRKTAYAIMIDDLQRLDPPVDPFERYENFKPPQSFMYLKSGQLGGYGVHGD